MSIRKVLIANRGEIAVRVIRACRELEISTVAVYSDDDVNALHVKLADEAYHIGASPPRESYLNIERIVETARKAGADAIHPGYGFLSENANFVDACEKAGIVFIGPRSSTMRFSGDKMAIKQLAKRLGIPVVPASDGILEDADKAAEFAREFGYPVLLKSAFGGGGRGIRLVTNEEQLRQEFELSTMEAKTAYGRAAMFVEKYFPRIRHIEFQLIRDMHGNGIYLFERECSIQRRYQKLVELAPSPVIDEETRHRIGGMVVKLADALDYINAGTVEFIRDESTGNLYLIEINSRLQVEHPVTEMITGKDLVKLQILVASGKELPFKQQDLRINGSAIECRINAEDPLNEFAPSYGKVGSVSIPYGPGIRVDTYLYPGCNVSGYYDSLVAKVIAWGSTFDEARRRMRNALDEFYIEGINTTIPLHRFIMDEPAFSRGEISTDYLDRFNIIERMQESIKARMQSRIDAIAAATLIFTQMSRYLASNGNGMRGNVSNNKQSTKERAKVSAWKRAGMLMLARGSMYEV
ncbi:MULTISPECIES: acetyl-CoA carboxylase biotin carboxylase subunit [Candidatus Nitrosocaldus]|jgi:acetyl-CoA/propionyl-CoA carboxylase|uniref:Acetyl-CoA/propionyl-CoA carboxylase, biotin carboxylation subunit n=1 Tax=Candidatus Nitrosocaldus cavascurensis TaxID=2058097 RepID=A0A2K5ASZ3_9ARCH|nr:MULTISPECIES: acetyl-CoA carboxylase biotin carboxylase subunit [Candidatus Nitrosocaldus]SPC34770.1 acetyl-CoA/propionyl-CoA carboxylase, biotin carboxylation subunit [Candidatus Nitrosocaldus cavascurensis]